MSAAKPDTWMPMYWGDYLRDTMHLRTEGHGAYLMLIAAYWCNGGALPDDDDYLSAITKVEPKAWQKLRPTLSKFFDVADGFWAHGRVEHEISKAKHISNVRQEAGKLGGKAKANATDLSRQTGKQNATQPQPPSQEVRKNPPIPPKGGGGRGSRPEGWTEEHETGFERLWESYAKLDINPKGPARKAYVQAIKSGADPDVLAARAAAYCAVCQQTETIICHLRTWLSQRRWEDDVGGAEVKSESQVIRERAETDAHQATIKRSAEKAAAERLARLREIAPPPSGATEGHATGPDLVAAAPAFIRTTGQI